MDSCKQSFTERYFPALKEKNFRVYWIGQCVSLIGTWMQNVGQSWLVLELTGSAQKLSVISALQFLPMMLFSAFAGPIIDAFPKKRTLIITQTVLALLALVLALITMTGIVQYWMVLVLALLLGFVQLVDNPCRHAYVIELSGKSALTNAVALNSAAFNLARIAGPAVAGIMIEALGIGPCFLLNSLSFLAVILALFSIKTPHIAMLKKPESVKDVIDQTKDGIVYTARNKNIAVPLLLLGVISLFLINYNIMVPSFARNVLGRSASGYGFLMTALGLGSFLAALTLAIRSGKGPNLVRLYGGALGLSITAIMLSLQHNYAITAILLGIIGFCTISLSTSTNAVLQLESDNEHRGRVMSIFMLIFGGVTPIGALYAGTLIEHAGTAFYLKVSGLIGIAASLVALAVVARKKRRDLLAGAEALNAESGT